MLLPMNLDDFLKITEDNDRRIWHYERKDLFELYTVSEGVISYTELPKEGLNMERVFSSKPFIGSKPLPASLAVVNNYNFIYLNDQMQGPKTVSSPTEPEEEVEEEEKIEPENIEGERPGYHSFY